ncbi:MAG: response regulator [Planctomycetota bacterium]|jgi:DNA-binding response OmpR family regulator|nr:response regulator [Planctomycetota bacterium]
MAKWTLDEVNRLYDTLYPNDPVPTTYRDVLWLDRDTPGAAAIAAYLGRNGFNCTMADSPMNALTQIDNGFFDVCIFELDLRPMTGIDLLEILRRDPAHSQMPVVILSGHEPARFVRERTLTQLFGRAALLKKPLTANTLMALFNLLNTTATDAVA